MNRGIVKYKLTGFIRSGKGIVPMVVFVAWLGMMYSIGPVDVLGSFGLCSLLLFAVMLSISIIFSSYRNPMIEMSFLVKVKNKKQIYIANLIVIYLYSVILSIVGLIVPVFYYVIGGFSLFSRPLVITDILAGGILMFLVAVCGGIIGQFADKNIVNNQKTAVLSGIIITFFVLFKDGFVDKVPVLKYILYILPPVNDLAKMFNEMNEFDLLKSIGYYLWIIAYIIILHFLYLKIIMFRKMD